MLYLWVYFQHKVKTTILEKECEQEHKEEELDEADFQSEVMEVVTQEELQVEGTLMEEVPDFLAVMELYSDLKIYNQIPKKLKNSSKNIFKIKTKSWLKNYSKGT